MEEKTNGIKKLFESDKARKIIVIIGIIGIALIFISSISGINTDKKTETEGFSVTTYSKKSFQVSAAAEKQRCFLP